jgi:hypothetical protein
MDCTPRKMDGSTFGLCPIACFDINSVEPSGSALRELIGLYVAIYLTSLFHVINPSSHIVVLIYEWFLILR